MFCWCRIEVAKLEGAPPPPTPVALGKPREAADGREYYRKDRMCWYLIRDSKRHGSDKAGSQRTEVCNKRQLGRPSKRARAAVVDHSASQAGESNSAVDSCPASGYQDLVDSASPHDPLEAEF